MVGDDSGAGVKVTSGGEIPDSLLEEESKLSEEEERTGIF